MNPTTDDLVNIQQFIAESQLADGQTAQILAVNLTNIESQNHTVAHWHHCSLNALQNLPFDRRYDLALVMLDDWTADIQQGIVRLRDVLAKKVLIVCQQHEHMLRALGFSQVLSPQTSHTSHTFQIAQGTQHSQVWQFNILNYKHVPDWLNAKYWANPENFDKYRW